MSRRQPALRRGVAAVIMVVLLVTVSLIVVGMVLGGARDQDLSARRLESVQAFYAAEAGVNMSMRELMVNADEDGDGAIGTISDDSNDGTDPTLGTGQVVVTQDLTGGVLTLTSAGRAGQTRRVIESELQ